MLRRNPQATRCWRMSETLEKALQIYDDGIAEATAHNTNLLTGMQKRLHRHRWALQKVIESLQATPDRAIKQAIEALEFLKQFTDKYQALVAANQAIAALQGCEIPDNSSTSDHFREVTKKVDSPATEQPKTVKARIEALGKQYEFDVPLH